MKTLHNHTILYDTDCPMCNLYTTAFVKSGMLDQNGREAYQQMPAEFCTLVDRQRAVDEIALVNKVTGEVTYGINSLFRIFGNACPLLKPLFVFKPLIYVMSKVYTFISANRKVIIPVKEKSTAIRPTFKPKYRLAYIVFAWIITSMILTEYANTLTPLVPIGNRYREYLICGGQVLVQGVIVSFVCNHKRWDYLGNMMTISFAGSLFLLPVILLTKFISVNPALAIAYFMVVAGCMLLEHIRRTKILLLGWTLTISWIIYRLVVLLTIL